MLHIVGGGIHFRHRDHFLMQRKKGVPEYLLLIIKTEAVFILNHETTIVPPHTIILIDRHTPYEYHNTQNEYIDDWLHFDLHDHAYRQRLTPIMNQFFTCRNLTQLESYLEQLLWENEYAADKFKKENVFFLFKTLMNNVIDVYEQRDNVIQNNPYYRLFQELRLTIQADPKLTLSANEIAQTLEISVSHFHHLYKEFFQTSFRHELIAFRIKQAKKLLVTTELSLTDIMLACGYQSETHFYRQFKLHVKLTPSQYRLTHLQTIP